MPSFRSTRSRNTILALLLWSIVMGGLLAWMYTVHQNEKLAQARVIALTNIDKDLTFRRWVTSHGGVYVLPDARTPPNPYLAQIPERDVVTTTGKKLTLMNPAYVLRQAMADYTDKFGGRAHLTSLQLTNPINQPDAWEQAAMESFMHGVQQAETVTELDGTPHLRLIKPLLMEQGCLKCHANTGVKVGGVRGAISVAVPLAPIMAIFEQEIKGVILIYGTIWLLGLGTIGFLNLRSRREAVMQEQSQRAIEASESRFRQLASQAPGVIFQYRQFPDGRSAFPYASEGLREIYGVTPEQVKDDASAVLTLLHPDDYAGFIVSLRQSAQTMTPWQHEYRVVLPGRGDCWRLANARPEQLADGSVLWHGFVSDITARKRLEQEIEFKNVLLTTQMEVAADGIWTVDAEGQVLAYNQRFVQMWEIPPDVLEKKSDALALESMQDQLIDSDSFLEKIHHLYQHPQETSHDEIELIDGRVFERYSASMFNERDECLGRVWNFRDITSHKDAERSLRRMNHALATIKACNEELIRATTEAQLLREICELLVTKGGHRMAAVGFVEEGADQIIRMVEHAGYEEGYLSSVYMTAAPGEHGNGPSGLAIRSGQYKFCRDIATDPAYAPWREEALKRGYASSIALPLMVAGEKPFGVLTIYSGERDAFDEQEVRLLIELSGDLAYGIKSLRASAERDRIALSLQQQEVQLMKSLEDSIRAIAGTVEMRDPYTAGHQQRVAKLACAIAQQMGLSEERIHGLRLASLIHDVGKIAIPAEILSKPGQISPVELQIAKTHAQRGYDIIKDIEFPWPIAQMLLQHHERMDGSGYPNKLSGEQILIEARVLAVADVMEAMTSHRPYRAAQSIDAALAELEQARDTLLDGIAVSACIRLFRERGFNF